MITSSQLDILHHTLGVNAQRREPWRNHYVAGAGHYAQRDIAALVAADMMAEGHRPAFLDPADHVYFVTDAGREAALDLLPLPPKRTRYDEYLDSEVCESFAEWLGIEVPRLQYRYCYGSQKTQMRYFRGHRNWRSAVYGDWAPTKKAAKASYKQALKQACSNFSDEEYA